VTRICIVGHICVDATPALGGPAHLDAGRLVEIGPLTLTLGGCVANTARTLSALGTPARIHASVGDDDLGRVAQGLVDRIPGATGRLEVRPGRTTSYSVVIEQPGEDRVFWHHVGANAEFTGADLALEGVDLVHIGYPSLLPALLADDAAPLAELLERARRHGATTSVDLAVVDPRTAVGALDWDRILDRVAPLIDVITPSADDLTSALHRDAVDDDAALAALAEDLIRRGAGIAAVSGGSLGVHLATAPVARLREGGRVLAPLAERWAAVSVFRPAAPIARPLTTNGAGDASTAGVLHALIHGADPAEALDIAARAAAAVLTGGGAQDPGGRDAASPGIENPGTGAPTQQADGRAPIVLPGNRPAARFYRGGARIAAFRGEGQAEPHTPEDWIGSVTCVRGEDGVGRTRLPDGRLLVDALAADPVTWLGPEHVARWGADPKLLVKLLDAGQRLPVHAHPDGAFAGAHVGTSHGKAEAWHILTPGVVHLGLREDLSLPRLEALVAAQDPDALLALLHEVPVRPGDRVFVPPGTLHAIGEGVLLAEVQEPEDLSILVEWRDFALDGLRDGHLGLGFDLALRAVDREALSAADLGRLIRRRDDPAGLPADADPFFRLEERIVDGRDELAQGFAVVIVTDGAVQVGGASWPRGTTALVPHAAGAVIAHGRGTLLVCRPPLP
jgi:mannose-6-phosphate isomerase